MDRNFLRNFLHRGRKGDFFADLHDLSLAEGRLHRATSYVLCFVAAGFTGLALLVNIVEGNTELFMPLFAVIVAISGVFAWLLLRKNAEIGPLYACLIILGALGAFLIVQGGAPNGSSLFWFLLYPPMLTFSLGHRRGTFFFCVFLLFILLMLALPLQNLTQPLPLGTKIRFILAMLGAFVFSLGAEYSRFQTQEVLARTMARLEEDSLTDPLTGLGNRRCFYNFFTIFFLGSSAKKFPFSLAMADIDYFKKVNDTFGHEVGDKVLCHVANTLRSQCRDTDQLYRWGGEEFLILMPRTTAAEAQIVLERMRKKIEMSTGYENNTAKVAVTVSFGLCEGSTEEDVDTYIASADQNLYVAKRNGRNRIVGPGDGE